MKYKAIMTHNPQDFFECNEPDDLFIITEIEKPGDLGDVLKLVRGGYYAIITTDEGGGGGAKPDYQGDAANEPEGQ